MIIAAVGCGDGAYNVAIARAGDGVLEMTVVGAGDPAIELVVDSALEGLSDPADAEAAGEALGLEATGAEDGVGDFGGRGEREEASTHVLGCGSTGASGGRGRVSAK
jgi:hypothetical protein